MKKCPKCGKEMKDCCEKYNEFIKKYQKDDPALYSVGHNCGQSEYICDKCGYREYNNDIPLIRSNLVFVP